MGRGPDAAVRALVLLLGRFEDLHEGSVKVSEL